MINIPFEDYEKLLKSKSFHLTIGKVRQVIGLIIEVEGLEVFIGEICEIIINNKDKVLTEVVGFKNERVLLMPLGDIEGISPGCHVIPTGNALTVKVGNELLGKTLNGLGQPITPVKINVDKDYNINRKPPNPFERKKIENIMSTGIKAIDGLLTCGEGQRMGIFAGSGVGKSTLLGMISRYSDADINVIALIGERGREVLEFIENDLGDEGYKKSVVVCATSDEPPLVRMKGAYVATAIAEYFRDQGKKVMLMMDSVTRFAMSLREVGLAIGEPPTTKGYTPSVFATLPKLLERSGTSSKGSITAFYTVLVEGDDFNEPITDSVRGILDGHIILSRKLAAKNHFPAIDIKNSTSRIMKNLVSKDHFLLAGQIKENMAIYSENEDLINIAAYKNGSNSIIDRAISLNKPINDFLKQDIEEKYDYNNTIKIIEDILS